MRTAAFTSHFSFLFYPFSLPLKTPLLPFYLFTFS
nr:MAG TPA: hypothetical protein [Caudoviricetes sp.]